MDPNANLTEQLAIAQRIVKTWDESDALSVPVARDLAEDARRLAELVLALDGWIRNSGFLPDAWEASRYDA